MADPIHIDHLTGGKVVSRLLDAAVAALAERQHGVVSRAQLLALGLSRRAIELRIERGWLRPVHRGVYAVGHRALRREGWWMAAVLTGGRGAVLSHRSAAALWELRAGGGGRTDVTVRQPGRAGGHSRAQGATAF